MSFGVVVSGSLVWVWREVVPVYMSDFSDSDFMGSSSSGSIMGSESAEGHMDYPPPLVLRPCLNNIKVGQYCVFLLIL